MNGKKTSSLSDCSEGGSKQQPVELSAGAERRRMVIGSVSMDVLIETLNAKLREWKPEMAAQVRERLTEIIGMADQKVLDLLRSREIEQEVLDILNASAAQVRSGWRTSA
jgi:hypothetical protein